MAKEIVRKDHKHDDSNNDNLRNNLSTDGITKLLGTLICVAVLYCSEEADGLVYYVTKLECLVVYLLLALSGVFDIMVAKYKRLPLWTRNVAFIMALLGEAFIFMNKSNTFSDVVVNLNCALVLIICFAIITELAECMFSDNTTTALFRGFLAFLHGACLIGIAVMKNNRQNASTGAYIFRTYLNQKTA